MSSAWDEVSRRLRRLEAIEIAMRAVDDQDWEYLLSQLDDGGRARFWKEVVRELRKATAPPSNNENDSEGKA